MATSSEFQKFDAVMRKILSVFERRAKKTREDVEAETGKEKAGDFLARLPRPCRRAARVWVRSCSIWLARQLSERNALADDLPDGEIEATSVIKLFTVVEAKHLFVKVTVKMERLYAHIGSRDATFQERPEILKAIGMHAAIYVLSRMVNDLMRIVRCQSFVGHERIAVESRASSYMLAYLPLQ
jgi:hypothetical protein